MAMNSLLVGFALVTLMVYPNRLRIDSMFPRLQATSMAWRIARSTRLGVVLYFSAMRGYNVLVMAPSSSTSRYTMAIASRRYRYPLIWAGTPISWIKWVMLASRFDAWALVPWAAGADVVLP